MVAFLVQGGVMSMALVFVLSTWLSTILGCYWLCRGLWLPARLGGTNDVWLLSSQISGNLWFKPRKFFIWTDSLIVRISERSCKYFSRPFFFSSLSKFCTVGAKLWIISVSTARWRELSGNLTEGYYFRRLSWSYMNASYPYVTIHDCPFRLTFILYSVAWFPWAYLSCKHPMICTYNYVLKRVLRLDGLSYVQVSMCSINTSLEKKTLQYMH